MGASTDRAGVALLNMGGPAGPDEVEPFLRELFADPAILGVPWPVRPLLAGWIARRRAPHSALRYERHGGASPLLAATADQATALEDRLGWPVAVAMRYGRPTSREALDELARRGVARVVALPLYPQYSTTTSATSLEALRQAAAVRGMALAEVESYPELPGLLDAIEGAVETQLAAARADGDDARIHLLFAAHGIPLSRVRRGDPYPGQVASTARAVGERLDLPWSLAFQSRVGPARWLEPTVEDEVDRLAADGVETLVVQPLTFVSENLETLDDLDRELAAHASERGIHRFLRGAAPGTDPAFIGGLAELARARAAAAGWRTTNGKTRTGRTLGRAASEDSMRDVIVIGGGLSGLAAGYSLASEGRSVRVFEAQDEPGGNIRTRDVEGHLMESGPHSWMGSAESMWDLVERLGLDDRVQETRPESRQRFIWRGGSLRRLPSGPASAVTTSILGTGAKLRLLAEPFVRGDAHEDDTVDAFFRRRFGDEAADYLAGPFVSGIYAGDARQIGARASFPLLWKAEREHGSVVRGLMKHLKQKRREREAAVDARPVRRGQFSLVGGMGALSDAMAARLGDDLWTSTPARQLTRIDGGWQLETDSGTHRARIAIVACPPDDTARLLAPLDGDLAQELRQIPLSPAAVVHLAGPEPSPFPRGFGFLVPRHQGIRTLGTVCISNLYPGRAPEGRWLVTSFIGGSLDPGALDLDDQALVDQVGSDNARLVNQVLEPDLARVLRYKAAIPQLLPDHPERVGRIRDRVTSRHPGLVLAGNYLTGVGMKDAAATGLEAAATAGALLG